MRFIAVVAGSVFVVLANAERAQATVVSEQACGEVITLATHGKSTSSYSLGDLASAGGAKPTAALVLLPGGGGFVDLDRNGCARKLTGNSLVRFRSLFHRAGLATALLDAPTDHRGEDGLGGFRTAQQHADDIGKVIADVRSRTGLPVWLVGTSRGTISAANAASHLTAAQAPDGVVLTSAITSGREGGYKAWVAQTVFSVNLQQIRVPLLVVAHASDSCIRTPPHLSGRIAAQASASRKQTVIVKGVSGQPGAPSVEACEGAAPHGFVGQDADVAAGITRFIRGEAY